jgi:flagellar motor switch/type III secretory pathway protein FliN
MEERPKSLEDSAPWDRVLGLGCDLRVEIEITDFRVRDATALAPEAVISTNWSVSTEVPLAVNGQLIAWAEFDVCDGHLAARVTELV